MATGRHDVCIIGCGLIGLAVGHRLLQARPDMGLLLVEKEGEVAAHQSSHNSGVVHSGLYYAPGSLKAQLAVAGRHAMYELCEREGIPFRRSGKIVVATRRSQLPALAELERRGRANGLIGLESLGPAGIRDLEPHAAGIQGLHVPEAGVADFPQVAATLADALVRGGATIITGAAVTAISHQPGGVSVTAGDQRHSARMVINCAGLHSDQVARLAGIDPPVRIVPFRGEYYRLGPRAEALVRHLVYPVPDPRFPFLGVHFTRRVDGSVEVGPNAVLAFGREQYRGQPADWDELRTLLGHRGFRRLVRRHWWSGTRELVQSRSVRLYARLASELVPGVTSSDLLPGGNGVRAQAVGNDGRLVDDFVIERVGSTVHVLNAPSPGATASLAIGRHIADSLLDH